MKAFEVLVIILVIGTTLTCFVSATNDKGKGSISLLFDMLTHRRDSMVMTVKSSKLQVERRVTEEDELGNYISVEDYHPINPVPSSKAKIRPKPIEHGTPLGPYIPKRAAPPTPPPKPSHPIPNHGGFTFP